MQWFVTALMVLIVSAGTWAGGGATAEASEDYIRFLWAFGAVKRTDGAQELIAVEQQTTLQTGDRLRMMVTPQNATFVYVIRQTARGVIQLLFPTTVQQFDTAYRPSQTYVIPSAERWMILDAQTGRETIYLLASRQRLWTLEERLAAYAAASTPAQPHLAARVVEAIQQTQKRHRTLTASAERPITIAGKLRGQPHPPPGGGPDITPLTVAITAYKFYSKTFTIEHR